MSLAARAIVAALAVLLTALDARAGNDDEILIGSQGARMGGAVTAIVDDGTAVWFNPGAIGRAGEQTLDIAGTAYQARYSVARGLLQSDSGRRADGSLLELFAAPSTLAHQVPLDGGWGLGYGVFTTKRESGLLRASLDGATDAELKSWELAQSDEAQRYNLGLGISLPQGSLRIGASMFVVYEQAASTLQITGGLSGAGQSSVTIIEQSWRWSLGGQAVLGLLYEPTDRWALGFALASPFLSLANSVNDLSSTEITLFAADGTINRERSVSPRRQFEPSVAVPSPFRLRSGLAYRRGVAVLSFDADFQPALRRPTLNVDRREIFNLRAGTDIELNETTSLGLGLFTDLDPDAASARVDFYGFAAGLETRNRRRLEPGQGADALVFSGFVGVRYALGVGRVEGLRIGAFETSPEPLRTVESRVWVNEIGLNAGTGLRF
jgi:hypothetical protein